MNDFQQKSLDKKEFWMESFIEQQFYGIQSLKKNSPKKFGDTNFKENLITTSSLCKNEIL